MLKHILKVNGIKRLNRSEQQEISGGFTPNCTVYTESQCVNCGGGHLSSGCCMGSPQVHFCLSGSGGGIGD